LLPGGVDIERSPAEVPGACIAADRERDLTVEDIRVALGNGDDIESRPDDQPYPSRLVLGTCRLGSPYVAVRDTIDDDEIGLVNDGE
jgi:hypothetical protein